MTVSAGITLVVLAIMAGVLARNMVAPSVAVVGAVVALLVMGVLTPQEAFAGFSNPAPLTVAALYVLARGIEKTGALQPIVAATLGGASSPRRSLARLLVPSATASAFLNNTPIVAMLMPQVSRWAEEWSQPVSRYLMPLSFAAILGGTVTLIGTSTNLVVSGLLDAAGEPPLSMFELARVGLPVAVIGVIFVVMAAPTLLPDRRSARHAVEEAFREFTVAMMVEPRGPLDGTTVEGGRLRHLQGVFLVEIERQGDIIAPVAPETVLRGRDRLTFVGRADQVVDLQGIRGLESSEREHLSKFDSIGHTFFEAVVGPTSPLNGRTLREMGFRNQYQAAVVAIHRAGHRVKAKLGGVKLRVGDTLLLLSDPGFEGRWRDRSPFLVVARIGGTPPAVSKKAWLAGAIGVGIVVTAGLGLMPVLNAALVGAFLLVGFGVVTAGEARGSVDLDVVLTIAAAFGLANALRSSGLAESAASVLVDVFSGFGVRGGLLAVVLPTIVLLSLITNNAAAVLMFPIAMSTASELGVASRPFAIALALAASASFLTPVAYQTNLMVYGPGGYKFSDYARLGVPLTLLVLGAIIVLVPFFWPL